MATDEIEKHSEEFHEEVRAFFADALRPPWIANNKPNQLDEYLDKLVPRGGAHPLYLYVSLEDYLSRLSILSRKIDGVRHRKEQWDRIVRVHIDKFQALNSAWQKSFNETPELSTYLSLGFRDVRVENEFEVILYAICSTLNALTKVIAAFLQGNEKMHSHSKLPSVLLLHGWESLTKIVSKASNEWVEDVVSRRDAATHYVALTAASMLNYPTNGRASQKPSSIGVAITKKPNKYFPLWLDDVPVIGGTSTITTHTTDYNRKIKDIRDKDDHLIIKRSGQPPSLPEMIDGVEYVNVNVQYLEGYIASVLQELLTKAK